MKHLRTLQTGFAAIAAIVIVVLLAALGGFMLTFSNTQQLTAAQDVQGSRAYWAARAGLEWAIASVGATACWATPPPVSVDGFSLTITCIASSVYTDRAVAGTIGSVYMFQLTSVARAGTIGTPGYVERSVSASLEK